MTPPTVEPIDVAAAMERWGGSFVKALGACIRHADPGNRAILQGSFPGYWQRYAEMAAQDRQANPHRYDIPVRSPRVGSACCCDRETPHGSACCPVHRTAGGTP